LRCQLRSHTYGIIPFTYDGCPRKDVMVLNWGEVNVSIPKSLDISRSLRVEIAKQTFPFPFRIKKRSLVKSISPPKASTEESSSRIQTSYPLVFFGFFGFFALPLIHPPPSAPSFSFLCLGDFDLCLRLPPGLRLDRCLRSTLAHL